MYKSEGKSLLIMCHTDTEGVCVQCHVTGA